MRNGNRKQFWLNLLILVTILVIVISDILTKEWIRSFPPDGGNYSESLVLPYYSHYEYRLGFRSFSGIFTGTSYHRSNRFVCAFRDGYFSIYRKYPQFVNIPNRIALGLILGGDLGI